MPITTEILLDGDPLTAILAGAEKLYKAVSATMGPRGGNVVFRKYGRTVGITHDGVTVAKLVRDDDEAADAAIDIMREAALKLDAMTGDGTTTVTVLTYHILKEAARAIREGENPMKLRLALEDLKQVIIDEIDRNTDKDVTLPKLIDVASVAGGSRKIGEEVAKIVFEAGSDTPVTLGFSESPRTYAELIDGFKINSGPASPYFIRGGGVKTEIINPYIIIVDAKLRDKEDIMPILRVGATLPDEERHLLFIASDIAGDALQFLIANHVKGFAEIACARVPQGINAHTEYLSDLAVAVGARMVSRNGNENIRDFKPEFFGHADRVTVEPLETVIIGGKRIQEDFDERVSQLQEMKKEHKTGPGRKFADDRLKTLTQKVVSIYVGGQTEQDAEERHYRYEDAIGASRAALRGGVVPGGGTLLCIASIQVFAQGAAGAILGAALCKPLDKIWENAGVEIKENSKAIAIGKGIDVLHPEDGVIDLVERGIIDPAESEIEAVKTAITVAGLLITTQALIVDRGNPDGQTSQPFSINQG